MAPISRPLALALAVSTGAFARSEGQDDYCICSGECQVYADPHVIDFSGQKFNLNDQAGINSTIYGVDGFDVKVFIREQDELDYITEVYFGPEQGLKVADCDHATQTFNFQAPLDAEAPLESQDVSVEVTCKYGPINCDASDQSPSCRWYLDVSLEKNLRVAYNQEIPTYEFVYIEQQVLGAEGACLDRVSLPLSDSCSCFSFPVTRSPTSVTLPPTLPPNDITLPPTEVPSEAPTAAPTSAPSMAPSVTFTNNPTARPSVSPTATPEPSSSPSVAPTSAPSVAPSILTTPAPSLVPTQAPSDEEPEPFGPQLCNSDVVEGPDMENFCELVLLDDFSGCCGYNIEPEEPLCRSQSTNGAWCKTGDLSTCTDKPLEEVKISLDLVVAQQDPDLVCCELCECHGDPECTAFDGSQTAWILCDGRTVNDGSTSCRIEQETCNSQLDHNGDQCRWDTEVASQIANRPSLVGVLGSPCQPNLDVSTPTMTMYKVDDFELSSSLGDRGIMVDITLATVDGPVVLDAKNCWTAHESGNPLDAWAVPPGSRLPNVTFSAMSNEELVWTVADLNTNILVQITCVRKEINNRAAIERLDVNYIAEPNVERRQSSGEGYCAAGTIDIGDATPLDVDMNEQCMALNNPSVWTQALVDPSASEVADETMIRRWCDLATIKSSEKDQCIRDIKRDGSGNGYKANWARRLCETNNLTGGAAAIEECQNKVQQLGIKEYVTNYGPGYLQAHSSAARCATSLDQYGKLDAEGSCQMGLSVEWLDASSNEWTQEFFIPTDFPPCPGVLLDVFATDYPDLFLHSVRFRQCDLPVQCLIENRCEQVPGFSTSIQFSGCQQ